ncbi:hypothetical protein GOP47_0015039 [Adiantum capillus-veneris]|uniref:Uncharacterized protein n=1 Tax=Adiantum capillus-veneris TaxID=13818 RepID=A0A9D4UNB3_ADICA|nr:hypothetical protein GOP47_0015039 [Adiantum capillus-veneris]
MEPPSAPSISRFFSSEAAAKEAFAKLQPLCSRLLELPLRGFQSDFDTSILLSLRGALHDVPLQGLQVCSEYVLFPLQLLLDASIASRSQRSSKEANTIQPILPPISKQPPDLHIADKIAEGVLGCIEELLLRCPITMTSQLSVLLRKLTAAAMLSSDEASEEFRHAAVKCLKIMFSGLQSCGRSFCGCKLSALRNSIISNEGSLKVDIVSTLSFLSQNTSEGQVEEEMGESCEDCPIEFLQSEKMSAPVGHLLSLFLQKVKLQKEELAAPTCGLMLSWLFVS